MDGQLAQRQRQLLKYRWEFTRRDPLYREMYDRMLSLNGLMEMGCQILNIQAMQHDPADDFSSKLQVFQSQADILIKVVKDLDMQFETKFGFPFFYHYTPTNALKKSNRI